jgi:hypothetical protein
MVKSTSLSLQRADSAAMRKEKKNNPTQNKSIIWYHKPQTPTTANQPKGKKKKKQKK